MRYELSGQLVTRDTSFANEVIEATGVRVDRCYQCMTCTLGCPVADVMDYPPNQVMRLIDLGAKDVLLHSRTIWMCVTCENCFARCPNQIDTAAVMDYLREEATAQGVKVPEERIQLLHRVFVENIKSFGKVHEATMLMAYKLRSKDFFSDMGIGLKLFLKGKIPLFPAKVKGLDQVKKIFEKTYDKTFGGRS